VVVVDDGALSGVVGAVVGLVGPPVLGPAIAVTGGRLKAMTVAMTPTARLLACLMADTLARLKRPL
jgi:hypothetical protein